MALIDNLAAALSRPADDIAPILSGIDTAAIEAGLRGQITHEVWDKASPINGVAADALLGRSDVNPAAEIYLIHNQATDRTYFQPHVPGVSGLVWMTPSDVDGYAHAHVDSLVAECVFTEALRLVGDALTP